MGALGLGAATAGAAATRDEGAPEVGGCGAAGAAPEARGAAGAGVAAGAATDEPGAPGARVGNLIVGAEVGFGGKLIRTVSFLG
jgi:hypothetical protein